MDTKDVMKRRAADLSDVERADDRVVYSPDVDIMENEKEIVLIADMPGVDEKSVNVTLEDDVLRLEGCVARRSGGSGYRAELLEYGVGNYERSFKILSDVDRSAVEAKVGNGVLRVVLPKSQKARRHVVSVAAE